LQIAAVAVGLTLQQENDVMTIGDTSLGAATASAPLTNAKTFIRGLPKTELRMRRRTALRAGCLRPLWGVAKPRASAPATTPPAHPEIRGCGAGGQLRR